MAALHNCHMFNGAARCTVAACLLVEQRAGQEAGAPTDTDYAGVRDYATETWNVVVAGANEHGVRNAQVTVLAPMAPSIPLMMRSAASFQPR